MVAAAPRQDGSDLVWRSSSKHLMVSVIGSPTLGRAGVTSKLKNGSLADATPGTTDSATTAKRDGNPSHPIPVHRGVAVSSDPLDALAEPIRVAPTSHPRGSSSPCAAFDLSRGSRGRRRRSPCELLDAVGLRVDMQRPPIRAVRMQDH
jgi:hypothetical protein